MSEAARGPGNDEHAGQPVEPRPRLAVIIGGQPGSVDEFRVDDPDRVIRAWSVLNASDQELHQVRLPPDAASRLGRQLHALAAELEKSLSPALAAELQHLLRFSGSEAQTLAELRVEYAGMLGWTGGLVIAVLGQLENASARHGAPRPEPPSE